MKIHISARGDQPLTVVLEPSGMEYVIEPGDHLIYQWAEERTGQQPTGAIVHEPGTITVCEASGPSRLWNSRGEELSIVGGAI